jgi:exopolyphosphatase / guanosine-5'-triphosphate,3'-diphosphate pyrophosphatase
MISASMPGVLPETPLRVERGRLILRMRGKYAALAGERVFNRLRTLARLIGREPHLVMD